MLSVEIICPGGTCVIEVDDLEFCEEANCLAAHFAEAHASRFHAPEWDMCFASDRRGIYMDDTCLKLVDEFESS